MVLSAQKSWKGSSEEPRECLGKKKTKSSHNPAPADLWVVLKAGRVPTEGDSRVQGAIAGRHWDLPRRLLSSRAGMGLTVSIP